VIRPVVILDRGGRQIEHDASVQDVHLNDVDLAIAAAGAGAGVVRSKYGTRLTRIEKSPLDFATDADVEAEHVILEVLRTARPDDRLIGEESGIARSGSTERSWLIDPLCGTLNYAAHTPLVAVNVALRVNNQITAAASADPFTGEMMWTDGASAFLRRDARDEPLRPSAASMLVDVNLDGPYPNAGQFRAVQVLAAPEFANAFRPRVSSTTLALAWAAAGRRAAYLTDGHLLDSVHFSSGIALCQTAGCVVTGLRGQPLHTGVGGLVVAADEHIHAMLIGIIDKQFADS
jgi:myo-inositol-1(or 4)-monophosphatase